MGKPGAQRQREYLELKNEKDRSRYLEKRRLRKNQKLKKKIKTKGSEKYIEHVKKDKEKKLKRQRKKALICSRELV